ncbi:MAG: hypothetical protein UY07_C0045G0005 [Parcubacteria group bacterium GW2011_GWA1_47_8]|nr:MAG: hypothetical protein UY07_C0045G0005 [Parcubacteria group bacterium GW2011_GWA1_47_8]KKW07990.1 MAG: hypothetical protein UY42_C0002G0039 [Parcubacteria group bacterium GW2011_GWA2_49_16]
MKNLKISLIGVAFVLAFASAAHADSWMDFMSFMSNSSFLHGKGVSANSGSVYVNGGSSDGTSAVGASSQQYTGGTVFSTGHGHHGRGEGLAEGNTNTWASMSQSPSVTSVSTGSNASSFTSSSGHVTSTQYAGSNVNGFAVNFPVVTAPVVPTTP